MNDSIRLIALNAALAAAGLVVIRFAGIPGGRGWRGTVVGLAPAVGLALGGLAAALGAMTGLGVGLLETGILVVLAVAAAGLLLQGRRPAIATLGPPPGQGVIGRVVELVLLVLLGVLSIGVLRLYWATGLTQWDGWAMWAPKAHALYVEGDVWGPVFRSPAYLMQHQEYPVLLPSLEALSADAVGRFDRGLIDIESGALLVSFGWGAWALLRLVVTPWLAAGVALALTGSVHLIDNGSANYADTALASFTALGLLSAFVWLSRGATAVLVLSAVFFAAAASTKAEGLLYALAAIAAVLATARGFGRSLRPVAVVRSRGARRSRDVGDRRPTQWVRHKKRGPSGAHRSLHDGRRLRPDPGIRLAPSLRELERVVAGVRVHGGLARSGLPRTPVVAGGVRRPLGWALPRRADRRVLRERLSDRLAPRNLGRSGGLLGRARACHLRAGAGQCGLGDDGRARGRAGDDPGAGPTARISRL